MESGRSSSFFLSRSFGLVVQEGVNRNRLLMGTGTLCWGKAVGEEVGEK